MRKVIVHMQTTLNGRIVNIEGGFWEPFAWGEEETRWSNDLFRRADTWVFGRHVYDAVAPWWTQVANGERPDDLTEITEAMADFAAILTGLHKVVFSTTLASTDDRTVISGDIAAHVNALKQGDGPDIIVSCGPTALATLADAAVIDEYLLVIHPAVITNGPAMFENLTTNLALELIEHTVFAAGAVIVRYAVKASVL
jgi:dihydrofolate reductase